MAPEDPVDMSAEKEGGGERSKSVSSNSSSSSEQSHSTVKVDAKSIMPTASKATSAAPATTTPALASKAPPPGMPQIQVPKAIAKQCLPKSVST